MNWVESLIMIFVIVALTLSIVSINRVDAEGEGLVHAQSASKTIQSLETTLPLQFDFKFSPEFSDVPTFVQLNATNVLSGKPCSSMLYSLSKTDLSAVVYDCEPPGNVVTRTMVVSRPRNSGAGGSKIYNSCISTSSFMVNNETVPAFAYIFFDGSGHANIMYSIAKDANGSQWNEPVSLSENLLDFNKAFEFCLSRLLNIDGAPVLAFSSPLTSEIIYVHGADSTFTTIAHTSKIYVNNLNPYALGLAFNALKQPVIICSDLSDVFSYVSQTNGETWNTPVTVLSALTGTPLGIDVLLSEARLAVLVTTSFECYYKLSLDADGLSWPTSSGLIQSGTFRADRPQLFVFDNRMSANVQSLFNSVIIHSNDSLGSAWPTGDTITVNSSGTSVSCTVCVHQSILTLCYVDEYGDVQYGTFTSNNLYNVTNKLYTRNLNLVYKFLNGNIVISSLIGNNITFGFTTTFVQNPAGGTGNPVTQNRLIFYKPSTKTLDIESGYTLKYTALIS